VSYVSKTWLIGLLSNSSPFLRRVNSIHLSKIKQRPQKSLEDFVKRFHQEAVLIFDLEDKVVYTSFLNNLKSGRFKFSLTSGDHSSGGTEESCRLHPCQPRSAPKVWMLPRRLRFPLIGTQAQEIGDRSSILGLPRNLEAFSWKWRGTLCSTKIAATIIGGYAEGISRSPRKAQLRGAQQVLMAEQSSRVTVPTIVFSRGEGPRFTSPHNDLLMVEMKVASAIVRRIPIYTRSSMDIT